MINSFFLRKKSKKFLFDNFCFFPAGLDSRVLSLNSEDLWSSRKGQNAWGRTGQKQEPRRLTKWFRRKKVSRLVSNTLFWIPSAPGSPSDQNNSRIDPTGV